MDNTEAVEKLYSLLEDNGLDEYNTLTYRDQAQAILDAIQADPLAYVKPKPLEWYPKPDRWKTEILGVAHVIEPSDGEFDLYCIVSALEEFELGSFSTLESAQAAAYEDLCNRVKELF